jgi:hypothetical protein
MAPQLLVLGVMVVVGCGADERFPLREPLWSDPDQTPFAGEPEEYVSPFGWDGANQIVFRPVARFFAVDPAGRALNVNAYDEVPDSSWFTNRIGKRPLSDREIAQGSCGDKELDPNMPDGSWIVDKGKPNGANPGFRVNVPGYGKFMLKADRSDEPERATGATAIASRIYHAAGYFAPCDSVVYFKPSLLKLEPGLEVTDNSGITRPFDQAALDKVLAGASKRNGLVRMGASEWLPGKPLGPFQYSGTRDDDPNDVIDHEDRRELRGARLLAAWLNHFDTREQNTMDVLMADPKQEGHGYIRHYILDLGDCFGSVWDEVELSKRLGHAYYLDVPYVMEDFATFGLVARPWERTRRDAGIFNYFSARDFVPELWRGGYPNPAFVRMTEADGAWMARIIARFSDADIAAAVSVGKYDMASTRYLIDTLITRRDRILRRYFAELSGVADLHVRGDALCGTDLRLAASIVAEAGDATLSARVRVGETITAVAKSAVRSSAHGQLCVSLAAQRARQTDRSTSPEYLIVEIDDGYAETPLRAHLYDLGRATALRLVGIERE